MGSGAPTLSPPKPAQNEDYLSGESTRAASPTGDDETTVTKEKVVAASVKAASAKDVEAGAVKESGNGEDEIEYPTGLPFVFIIVALVLSIFLVSLDMVCLKQP